MGDADPLEFEGYIAANFNDAGPVHEVNGGHIVHIRDISAWTCDGDVSAQHIQAGAGTITRCCCWAAAELLLCQLLH